MKMINGQLPTWYVIKRISADGKLYARAPNTDDHYAAKAQQICGDTALYVKRDGRWEDFVLEVPSRNDWTLYRLGGKKRKVNLPEINLGRVVSNTLTLLGEDAVFSKLCDIQLGTFDIIAVPVKS